METDIGLQPSSHETGKLLAGLERAELIEAFEENRDSLLKMVQLRLDRRMAARVDASDIVQEAFIRANSAFESFRKLDNVPLAAWLRIQTRYAVGDCHRRHLHTQKRAAGNEQDLQAEHPDESTCAPALELMAQSMISPGSKIANQELVERVREIISQMPEVDQEILILRHIEDRSIAEAATELGVSLETAKKRHLRALRRLQVSCQRLDPDSSDKN